MKRYLVVLLTVFVSLMANAQGRGIKIAYIDMEYILDKVPDYAEAKSQLEQKAAKWKQEMDVKRNDITKLKESLQAEKALLTKELIEEREEEIAFQEKELIDYQEKRFGPKGDLITQKSVMVKPIQDQVFNIVQDLAEVRKYDFVFDKSSDLTLLFAANKYDISDLIVKRLSRTAKREKLSSKEVKKLEEQEKQEEEDSDPDKIDKAKKLEAKKEARQKAIDDRKAAADAKRAAALEKRDQLRAENAAKRNGTTAPKTTPAKTEGKAADTPPTDGDDDTPATAATANKSAKTEEAKTEASEKNAEAAAKRQKAAEDAKAERERKLEERRKAIEDRKKQVQEQREAAQKAREEKLKAKNGTPATTEPEATPSPTNTQGED